LNLERHGVIESDQANILLVLKNYFEMLYKNNNTASDIELENYLSNMLLTSLSQTQIECICTEIPESEGLSALSNMLSNKSPIQKDILKVGLYRKRPRTRFAALV